jgi:hypothetical protein
VVQKASKGVANLTTKHAQATTTIQSLQFANIETIKIAMDEARAKEEAEKAKELVRLSRITEEDVVKKGSKGLEGNGEVTDGFFYFFMAVRVEMIGIFSI